MSLSHLKFLGDRKLNDLEATEHLAIEIITMLKPNQVIGLQGEMGSGKTHFVKAMARELGCHVNEVNSPSYSIHQEYQGSKLNLHHIDLFRLETEEEIESSGFWDLFYEKNSIIVIEWIDRIQQSNIPMNNPYLRMEWNILDDGERLVNIFSRETF